MMSFFAASRYLDSMVLRPLRHIRPNWELTWDQQNRQYRVEDNSFAAELNTLISQLEKTNPPSEYHGNEDCLAKYVQKNLKWGIHKVGKYWVGADYDSILEQGGYDDINEAELVLAAAGRIKAAIDRKQSHFDEMESSHQRMLGAVLSIILYHRG